MPIRPQQDRSPGSYEKLTNSLDGSKATRIDRFGNTIETRTSTVQSFERLPNGKPNLAKPNGEATVTVSTLRQYVEQTYPDQDEEADSLKVPDHEPKNCQLCQMVKGSKRRAIHPTKTENH